MAYEKHEWQTGETILATSLNHMEDGIEAANCKVLSITIEDGTINKTWKQINDCLINDGIIVYLNNGLIETSQEGLYCASVSTLKAITTNYNSSYDKPYLIVVNNDNGLEFYAASTQEDYPTIVEDVMPSGPEPT